MWRFLWTQTQLTLSFSLLVWGLLEFHAAISALSGGMMVVLGGCAYVLIAQRSENINPKAVLYLHFFAEIAKLLVMFVVVLILYGFYQQAKWQWVFAGCLVSYGAYWFGLLNKS